VRLAFLTDVHFGPRAYHQGKLRKLTDMAGELTARFVERMNAREKPDMVVNLGDVIEDESRELDLERYGHFVEILSGLSAPVTHVAGNHDTIHLGEPDLLGFWKRSGELFYSFDFGGLHFVVLRTIEIKDTAIHLPEAQIAFAAEDLANTRLPAIVLMHHPASDQELEGNYWFERAPHVCRVAERKKLRRVLEQSGKVRAVFNGHVHWNHFDVINGIPYFTLQSLIENVEPDAPGRPAAAFTVCDVSERRLVVNVHGEHPAHYQVDVIPPS
jgi:3',5'-cyclic AMP phosphodiesterase CpdA